MENKPKKLTFEELSHILNETRKDINYLMEYVRKTDNENKKLITFSVYNEFYDKNINIAWNMVKWLLNIEKTLLKKIVYDLKLANIYKGNLVSKDKIKVINLCSYILYNEYYNTCFTEIVEKKQKNK